MTINDMRLDVDTFKSFIGKDFKKYKHDPLIYTPTSYGIVGLYIDKEVYEINNEQEVVDYFGTNDEYAVLKFRRTTDEMIKSLLKNVEQITTKIEKKIKKIFLVNENQQTYENGIQTYNVWLTRAVIFIFDDDKELMFQKDITPFSEEIVIKKGYDLLKEIPSEDAFLDGWGDNIEPKSSRELITLT